MKGYYVTRNGQGPEIERNNQYKYQSLAVGFKDRKVNPFMVQVDPLPNGEKPHKNGHDGQEYDYVIEGTLEVTIEEKVMVLNSGLTGRQASKVSLYNYLIWEVLFRKLKKLSLPTVVRS